jgi:hypothetical protein
VWRLCSYGNSFGDICGCSITSILQAAAAVIEAMKDNHLSDVDQQILSSRGSLLLRRKGISIELKLKLVKNIKQPLREPPIVTIKAKSLQM